MLDTLLQRIGWSGQVPSAKAIERNEVKIAVWKEEQSPVIKGAADLGRLALLRGRSRPGPEAAPKGRTWSRRGPTPRWCGSPPGASNVSRWRR
ncbi:winged helix-turn-helix domain-containing protein [Streptomyces sp. NPDC056479]|uniref:winged helix-turn-helix domain-containing protein n=1 Tax=Streptomyces sp. NPDC056479 TaxID=3345832 RepID=UPI003689A9CC